MTLFKVTLIFSPCNAILLFCHDPIIYSYGFCEGFRVRVGKLYERKNLKFEKNNKWRIAKITVNDNMGRCLRSVRLSCEILPGWYRAV